jgi:hypothetical protein
MQPKLKMKKTLLASALIAGLGNAFYASSDTFTVTASAIPDVSATTRTDLVGGTEVSFGTAINTNPGNGDTCTVVGASNAFEADIAVNLDQNASNNATAEINTNTPITDGTNPYLPGDITGDGCVADTAGDGNGSVMVFEFDGSATAAVTVSIPDVSGTGWTWSPGTETCVTDYDNATTTDTCTDFDGINSVSTNLADAATTELDANADIENNEGKIKVLLGGTLTFDGTPLSGTISDTITISVTYD